MKKKESSKHWNKKTEAEDKKELIKALEVGEESGWIKGFDSIKTLSEIHRSSLP
ncbi:MAG: hypothetical protein SchgKO_11090 [Schleiferiaceae bacterium]